MIEQECDECGELFSSEEWRGQDFCSLSCATTARQSIQDESVFEDGLDPDRAYILGIIYSDGCLSYDANSDSYRITVSLKDLDIIKRIHNLMTPRKKIYERQGCHSIVSTNETDIEFLREMGMTERKSTTLKYPDVPDKLESHFVRGFFDGDGSVYKSVTQNRREHYTYVYANFTCGSYDFVIDLRRVLTGAGIYTTLQKDDRSENGAYQLHVKNKNHVRKFAEYIYQDSSFHMSRKHDVFADNDIV
jgi:intein-encoded DNA endonuclease-like protein